MRILNVEVVRVIHPYYMDIPRWFWQSFCPTITYKIFTGNVVCMVCVIVTVLGRSEKRRKNYDSASVFLEKAPTDQFVGQV